MILGGSLPAVLHRSREHESRLGHGLWAAVLLAAIAAVVVNFVSAPTSNGSLGAFARHLTLWVANAQADPQAEDVAQTLAGYWTLGSRASTVGLLPGSTAAAVTRFVDASGAEASENLLVLTSTTLSDITPPHGRGLVATHAPVVALLASDPLELAVSRTSPIHTVAEMRTALQVAPTRKLFGVASDPWLTGNLAVLVTDLGLRKRLLYKSFPTSASAIAGLQRGYDDMVLAPRDSLQSAVHKRLVRLLPWPGTAPRAWVALVSSKAVSGKQLQRLRTSARRLAHQPAWRAELVASGLTPVDTTDAELRTFLVKGTGSAQRLQAITARVIER